MDTPWSAYVADLALPGPESRGQARTTAIDTRIGKRIHALALAAYLLFFAAVFARFALEQRLPGNCDTWAWLVFWNTSFNDFVSLFTGEWIGRAMYPVASILDYGEAALGHGMVFILCRALGMGDTTAYAVFVTLAHGLAAFGVYLFATHFVTTVRAAFFAGLAFAASNFAFANIDTAISEAVFLPMVSYHLLLRHEKGRRPADLYASVLLLAWQVYFSVYVFAYFTLGWAILVLAGARRGLVENPRRAAVSAALFAALVAPFLARYLYTLMVLEFGSPAPPDMHLRLTSLTLASLARALPQNLVYPFAAFGRDVEPWWPMVRNCAFSGVLLSVLAVAGAAMGRGRRLIPLWFVAAGLMLSVNQRIVLSGFTVPSFLEVAYSLLPFLEFLRVPLRAHFLSLVGICVLAALCLDPLLARMGRRASASALFALVLAVHLVENVPVPPASYAYYPAPRAMVDFFSGMRGKIVLHMPSYHINEVEGDHNDLFYYNREFVYMNWQCRHRQHVLNGVNGYIPVSRMAIQNAIERLPSPEAFLAMGRERPDYVVYHENMELPADRANVARLFRLSSHLEPVLEKDGMTIYKVVGLGYGGTVETMGGAGTLTAKAGAAP
ncbi:MAG: hypothetical protein ACLFOY_10555 [Desulfatibacillaceae bacterium]